MVKDKAEMMAENVFNTVYVARVTKGEIGKVYPPERNMLIEKTKNEALKRERYSVWKLLERALAESFAADIRDFSFKRTDGGKWIAEGIYFSLSHTSELVAVAVSNSPIGVDIEKVKSTLSARTAERILAAEEFSEYRGVDERERGEYIIRKWSGKEALFKREELSAFVPHLYLPTEKNTVTYRLSEGTSTYILAVAADGEVRLVDLRDK